MALKPHAVLYTAAIAAGLTAGAFGVASAASTQTTTSSPAPTTTAGPDTVPDQVDNSDNADNSGTDGKDPAADPNESASLAAAAKVTEQQARDAASAAAGGTATKATLDNENGTVVWSVEVTRTDKTTVDVKIDAGNGAVLAQDSGHESAGHESGSSGQPDTDNVEHQDGPDNDNTTGAQSSSQNGGGQ